MSATAPLEMVGATYCPRDMVRGQVKRCMHRGPLVGYYIACPACGFKATYLDEDVGFIEEPAVVGSPFPKRLLGMRNPPPCYRCKLRLSVRGLELEAS
jgi:hypothetical protein